MRSHHPLLFLVSTVLSMLLRTEYVVGLAAPVMSGGKGRRTQACLERRKSVQAVVAGFTVLAFGASRADPARAFENKISTKYDDRPKRRGPQPKDLGVATRTTMDGIDDYMGFKICGAAPNCFSSTLSIDEDPDHSIPAWKWPQGLDREKATEELYQVLKSYPPGQNGVDGGGFQIQKYDKNSNYIYVVYEALKNGYYDDVEFAWIDGYGDRSIQVRSSSRVGYLDLGVNAKRLNWIAKELRSRGWDAVGVDYDTHQSYVLENDLRTN